MSINRVRNIFVTLFLLLSWPVHAQEAPAPAPTGGGSSSTSGIGLYAIMSHTPQEEDLSDTGGKSEVDKFEIFIDWNWLRFGYNWTHAAMDFSAYNSAWRTQMKKNTTYAAYRLSSAESQSKWDLYMLAGLAYTTASFNITGVASSSSADFGYITGGGVSYRMGRLDLGLQLSVISTQGNFDGVKIATGSTLLNYGAKLNF